MTIGIIGLGLIGGSMAKDIKRKKIAKSIVGYNQNKENCEDAVNLNLIDQVISFEELCKKSDLIILGIPVNEITRILPKVLDLISDNSIVTDVGSTKELIVNSVKNHPKRKRFVASHPMSGTEDSGPTSAIENLFLNKLSIICDQENSDSDAVKLISNFYQILGCRLIFMNSKVHDEHVGYVSHLSHVISYALSITLLEKEKTTSNIFDLAAGGFTSMTRLAKSSSDIWTPIFQQNIKNILPIIEIYIKKIIEFKTYLENNDFVKLNEYISNANQIRKVLIDKNKC